MAESVEEHNASSVGAAKPPQQAAQLPVDTAAGTIIKVPVSLVPATQRATIRPGSPGIADQPSEPAGEFRPGALASASGEHNQRRDGEVQTASPIRIASLWAVAAVAVLALFAGTIVVLNLTMFSAAGFATTYLQTLGAKDVAGALSMPGVELPAGLTSGEDARALLSQAALAEIKDIHTVSDVDLGNGNHEVTMSYTMQGASRESSVGQTIFLIHSTGRSFGFFSDWAFTQSPIATLTVQVQNASTVTVGSQTLSPEQLGINPDDFAARASYTVMVPGLYVVQHRSFLLESETVPIAMTTPGKQGVAIVSVHANAQFQAEVSDQVTEFLDSCVTQQTLFPVGCPFQKPISDRIVGAPQWSMVQYPTVSITADADSWVIAESTGIAHITVDVKSLFDGSVSTVTDDVPFQLKYTLRINDDNSVAFLPR